MADNNKTGRKRIPPREVLDAAKKIHRIIRRYKITQADLALISGVSSNYISLIFRNIDDDADKYRKINLEVLIGIVKICRNRSIYIDLEWLLFGKADSEMPTSGGANRVIRPLADRANPVAVAERQPPQYRQVEGLLACQDGADCEFTEFCRKNETDCAGYKNLTLPEPPPQPQNTEEINKLKERIENLERELKALRDRHDALSRVVKVKIQQE